MVEEIFSLKTLKVLLVLLFLGNLFYLDIFFLKNSSNKQPNIISSVPSPTPTTATTQPNNNAVCPQSCLAQIYLATSSTQMTITPSQNNVSNISNNTAAVKEFFVPFGSGSSTAGDWQDVAGLQATIDTANYTKIKNVTFEASIHIPTGNQSASVRLYNSSDKHPVWFSEVSMEGAGPKFLISSPIALDRGQKTYQVQAKTSLQYTAIIDQSRIHILTY